MKGRKREMERWKDKREKDRKRERDKNIKRDIYELHSVSRWFLNKRGYSLYSHIGCRYFLISLLRFQEMVVLTRTLHILSLSLSFSISPFLVLYLTFKSRSLSLFLFIFLFLSLSLSLSLFLSLFMTPIMTLTISVSHCLKVFVCDIASVIGEHVLFLKRAVVLVQQLYTANYHTFKITKMF